MKILSPNVKFSIKNAGQSLPASHPISNMDILKENLEIQRKTDHVLHKMDQKITQDFGFKQRYWSHHPGTNLADSTETSESLAYKAINDAFNHYFPKNVEAFVLGSTTTCRYTGSQAAAVLGKLNHVAPTFEIKAGCSTSLVALHLSHALIMAGYENVLVACAETLSKVIHPNLKETWFGLADGGAAVWLERHEDGEFIVEKSLYSSEGIYVDLLTTPASLPPTIEQLENHGYCLSGDFDLLRELALERYGSMIEAMLPSIEERNEIIWVIPHQVNRSIISSVVTKMGLNHAEIIWNADKSGNIGGASILYSLAKAIKDKIFNRPGKILLMSVGGGLTYAAQVWQFKPTVN